MGKGDQPHGDRWRLKVLVVSIPQHREKKYESVHTKYTVLETNVSPVPGILQARTLEWVAISFSNAGK